MKKITFLFVFLFIFISVVLSQENRLILVHPTEYNLKLFTYLIDNNIIQIDHLKITGVYHNKEVYDYTESKRFLENNNYPFIELLEIDADISAEDIFQKNNCSPIFENLFKNSKGIFFMGGPDLPPSIYGESMSTLTSMTDPYRHYFETSFLFHLLGSSRNTNQVPLLESNPDFVVYAICLGMQTMNVAAGGTMIQDIPDEIYHLNYVEDILTADNSSQHRNYNNNLYVDSTLFPGNFHEIKILDSKPIVGNSNNNNPLVYSNHHQAIEKLGMNLKVIATSTDGQIIEAIIHKKYPNVLGIQFHPEGTYLYNENLKYRKSPVDSLTSGKQILIENNSFDFHLNYWNTFSEKMNK